MVISAKKARQLFHFGTASINLILLFCTAAMAQPVVTSVSPDKGIVGTSITITGTGFNATASNNGVWFGATRATVSTASASQLIVSVPAGATTDFVSVTNLTSGLTAFSKNKFIPVFAGGGTIVSGSFASQVAFSANTNPKGIAIGDLDGDGKPDLAVANSGANTVSVYRNTSTSGSITTSSFASRVAFTTGSFPTHVAIGDIDGDGKPDLVVSNQSSFNISVLRNVSTSGSITTGSFQSHVTFAAGAGQKVAIADIDGDGKPDVVVANGVSNTVSVLRNTSTSGSITTGSFAAQVALNVNSVPLSVTIGDLDGDSKPDLAVTRRDDNSVAIYRNTSTSGSITSSSFAAQVTVSLGASPQDVAMGDVDGDGKLDLAISHSGTNAVSVIRNNSTNGSLTSGSFASPVSFSVGTTPMGIAFGDVNGDAKIDVAAVNMNSNAVSVLQNKGVSGGITSGSFASQVLFGTGSGPQFLALGDVDGDGKPEIITTSDQTSTLSVLRNTETADPVPEVTFRADMRPLQRAGIFNPATDTLKVLGNFTGVETSDWGSAAKGGVSMRLEDSSDSTWSATVSVTNPETTLAYKFRIRTTTDKYHNGGWETGENKTFTRQTNADAVPKRAPEIQAEAFFNATPLRVIVGSSITVTGDYFGTASTGKTISLGTTAQSSIPVTNLRNWSQTGFTGTIPQIAAGTYSLFYQTGTTLLAVSPFTITVDPPPAVSASSGSLTGFAATPSSASSVQSLTVSGSALTSNILVTASADYELRVSGGSGFSSGIILSPTSGTVSSSVEVRLKSGLTTGTKNGTLTLSSTGAANVSVSLSGTVSTAAITLSASSFAFSGNPGSPSISQTYTVSASGLTGPLLVSAPPGYEIRPSGSQNFVPSHSFPVGFAPTVVEIRMNGLAPGIYNGVVSHSSTGVTTQNVIVNGTCAFVEALLTPVTAQSGIWRQQTSLRGITPLTFHSNATTWFVGFTGGIMRSTNNGRDWTQVMTGNHIFDILEAGTNVLYAASYDGIYRSTNAGSTWELWKNGQFGTNWTAVFQLKAFNNQLYAGTGAGVWVSSDFSTSFTHVSSGLGTRPVTALAVHIDKLYAGTDANDGSSTIYVLNGTTWTSSFSPSFTLPIFRGGLSSVNGALYAGTIVNGLFRLSGTGFSRMTGMPTIPYHIHKVVGAGTSIFAGTSEGIYRSDNGGTTWTAFNTGISNVYLQHLAVRDTLLIASSDIGVWVSTPRATGWVIMQNGMSGTRITDLTASGTSILASTFGGTPGIYRSSNEGQTFTISQPGYFYRISATDAGVYAGDYNNLYLTTNNGQSWVAQPVTGLPGMEKNATARLGTVLFTANNWQEQGVFRFSGSSWSAVNTNLPTKRVAALAVHNNELFAGTDGGKVARFHSNFSSWLLDTAKTGTRVLPAHFYSLVSTGSSFFAATNDGVWERSPSGRWSQVAFPATQVNKLVISGNRIYAVGFAFFGISYDNGITWLDLRSGLPGLNIHSVTQTATTLQLATDGGMFIRPVSDFQPATPTLTSIGGSNIVNAGASITIQGTNFNATTTGNAVFFGAVRASITTASATQLQVTVPNAIDALGGVTLSVMVNGTTMNWPKKVFVQTTVSTSVPTASLRITPVSGKADASFYRLVGQPVRGISPSDLGFTAVDSTSWRMFRDIGTRYSEMALQSRSNFGEGAWIISKEPVSARAQSGSLAVSGTSVVIPVRAGAWNIITTPVNSSVNWSAIQALNPALSGSTPRSFNGSYSVATSLTPFDGYYVNIPAGVTEIVFPLGTLKGIAEPQPWIPDWQLGVRLMSGKAEDNDTRFGIGKGATTGRDRFELAEPPAAFDLPSVYVHRPDWDSTFTRFSDDFRPELGEGQIWDFVINSVDSRKVQLEITGLSQLPEGTDIVLMQPEKSVLHGVRSGTKLELELRPGSERYELAVGNARYLKEKSAAYIPAKFALEQNYPNPFNPTTTIRFSLNKSGPVTLSVWDITGRKVAEVLNRQMEPGFHQATFDAKSLSSGMYLYRLESASGVLVKKMMLVK
jgi:hypothetical protein